MSSSLDEDRQHVGKDEEEQHHHQPTTTTTSTTSTIASTTSSTAPTSNLASALRLLEQYFEADMISVEQLQFYKDKHTQLHTLAMETYQHEELLLKQAKQLNSELLSEKIQVEKQTIRKVEELASFTNLDKEKDRALKELNECIDRDMTLAFEMNELQRDHDDLMYQKQEFLEANAKVIEPEVKKLTEETSKLSEENRRLDMDIQKEMQRKKDFLHKVEFLQQDNVRLTNEVCFEQKNVTNSAKEPERMAKQAEVVQKVVHHMQNEITKCQSQITTQLDPILFDQSRQLQEADQVQKELNEKLQIHRETIDQRQRDVDTVTIHLREEQNTQMIRLGEKAHLEMTIKALEKAERRENEKISNQINLFDKLKRELKKKIYLTDQQKALLPNLKDQVIDVQHQQKNLEHLNEQLIAQQKELKQENDFLMANFLKKEQHETEKNEELSNWTKKVVLLEEELKNWILEENKQKKIIQLLSTQREIKAKEANSANEAEKNTQQELKMKELVILDLAKTCHETNNHLKEFSALYDVVKNERNKYVNLIQASTQALAEMKEKIKILANEVEVLHNESIAKDKALAKEKMTHQTAQSSRDALRMETNKCHETYRIKQEQVEQQIAVIDKLNTIISMTEKEMLRLKKKYEFAIEARNTIGVQLIDRNDELCILYEKANLQAKALSEGEIALQTKEQELRMLHIQLTDLQRQLENARKKTPQIPQIAQRILKLQQQIKEEKEITEMLCRDLETPQNTDRWRQLGGEDPDEEQLFTKLVFLEQKLDKKKEQLLEKELVLEEITNLSDKLRQQATERRGETLVVAKKVNDFQSKIKEITRKMMAIVSELSMYQATAMKMQQEKHDALVEYEQSVKNYESGNPPNAICEQELYRQQLYKMKDEENKFLKAQQKAAAIHAQNFPTQLTYTSAEPRPNAYIPEELGIPKPYGNQAPFKPTMPGSTMRHIRIPQKKDIEI
jgi:hypothetical protein